MNFNQLSENAEATDEAAYLRENFLWILVLTDVHVDDKAYFIHDLKSRLTFPPGEIIMYLAFQNGTYGDAQFFYDLIQRARFVTRIFILTLPRNELNSLSANSIRHSSLQISRKRHVTRPNELDLRTIRILFEVNFLR